MLLNGEAMDFDVTPFDGNPLAAIDELTGRDSGLVVVAAEFSRRTRRKPWIRINLLRFDHPDQVLAALRKKRAEFVAIDDDPQWDRARVADLLGSLRRNGKRVVFFTPQETDLGELVAVGRPMTVLGHDRGGTVVAVLVESGSGRPYLWPVLRDTHTLRILDLVKAVPALPPKPPSMSGVGKVMPGETIAPIFTVPVKRRRLLDEAPPAVRCVNTLVVFPGDDAAVTTPLATGAEYEVLVNIGPHVAGSLLAEPDARWPGERLPGGNLTLRAVLTMTGTTTRVTEFVLPVAGTGPWIRLPITAPAREQVWTGELVIYHEVVAVHVQRLNLPVGTGTGPSAELLYRLTRSFADLGPLRDRTASVLVTEGGARALVNGVRFADNPVWINAGAADNAVRAARQLLHDQHLRPARGGYTSTLDGRYGKDFRAFTADLADLARHGAVIYDRLFRDNRVFDTLPDLIRHEATARNRPAVLNVADPTVSDPDRAHPVPWSLVYDLRMPQDPNAPFRLCPSMEHFGPGGSAKDVPAHCPEPDHTGNVLCPFGFWGLSTIIEQPPSTEALVWYVFDDAMPTAVTVAVDPDLDHTLTRGHLAKLQGLGRVTATTVTDAEQLAKSLAGETMDVAYLYCHGGYHRAASNALPFPVLRFGRGFVDPVEVSNWRRDQTLWPRPHWPRRKPLVVLNGCHTTELTTATLANFVDAFANRAGAAGVIGTEVSVEQGMAGWVMEMLLRLLVDGASAGAALRAVRWRMIGRGNAMGLAYTLYGAAGLRLRPAVKETEYSR